MGVAAMKSWLREIRFDLEYVKNHQLQPAWFKILKLFILAAVIAAYGYFQGWARTAVFITGFMLLSAAVHFAYRRKTERFTKSWLDFRVRQEGGRLVTGRIGGYYYLAIIINAGIAAAASLVLVSSSR